MEGVEDIPGAALSEGIEWELGALSRVPRRGRARAEDARRRRAGAARRGARLRDGGARRQERTGHLRRHRCDGRHRARGHRSRRARLLDEPHDRAHGDRRRTRARHVRGRRRAVRHRRACSASSAPACSSSRRPARSAKTSPRPSARWRGCASCPRRSSGRSSFALTQNDHDPESWQLMLELCAEAAAEGAQVRPQVAGRPVSLLLGLQTFHPFAYCPSWAPIGGASLAEKVAAMRDPALRAKLLAEVDAAIAPMRQFLDPERAFPIGAVPDYEPARDEQRRRCSPARRVDPRWRCSTTRCSATTASRSCCGRCSTTRTSRSTRCARCSCTRRARGVSATAARTAAPPATRARRRSCSRTGRVTARTTACRSSGS